jgi:hypothetical protein
VSWDPEVETVFNDQKNEFGITVDALSWIPVRANGNLLSNYRKGFLRTPNLETRHVSLLYESTLSLPTVNGRVDFMDPLVPALSRQDFELMARFLVQVRDRTPARIFTLDGRPVVFIFGTHSWGRFPIEPEQYRAFEIAMDLCREAFRVEYGTLPYLVGEEMILSSRGVFADDRVRRSLSFDAIYAYHHASNLKPTVLSGANATLFVTPQYTQHQLALLGKTYEALSELRNRYTGQRILVIPNIAPGFAKPGLPTLKIDRPAYAGLLKLIQDFHVREYVQTEWADAIGTAALPAPVYVVGSWNEEFEGHCVFPSNLNRSLTNRVQEGFDLPMALKEAFGWNHYAQNPIVG